MRTKAFKFISMAVLIVAIATAVIYVLMLLWNWLVPDLFSGPEITFWQSAGLLLLSKILFSGFNKKKHAMSHKWKRDFAMRMSMMSDDEKEKLREKMRSKWGHWGCEIPEEPAEKEEDSQ